MSYQFFKPGCKDKQLFILTKFIFKFLYLFSNPSTAERATRFINGLRRYAAKTFCQIYFEKNSEIVFGDQY
ncbi:hypothetical protein DXN05_06370 [Deminuibacter soli]|uniref:Uncharacterized protein n=1 Tax=Deminuibacter soli TaxID=2291815 RepID=A0A3E1NRV3_9BACT|nr:hypothetical protein DXN05_06370 [Deminuibacter soli]